MAQFGRPSADTYNADGWVEDDDTSVNMFLEIDEVTQSDTDYIKSPLAPTSDVYVTKLTTLEDPVASTGHIVRYAYGKDTTGGAQIDITVQLRQGYVNEGTPGTLIHSEAHTNVASGFNAGSFTLSAGEADSITDYTDLYLRFVANQV